MALVVVLGCSQDDCTQENPRYCGDGTCTDPAFPFCDVNGTLGGLRGECIAPACLPGELAECRGDNELRCNSTGDGYDEIACEASCEANRGCANAALISIEPRTVSPGEALMLEGAFGSTIVVNFPGGISRSATRLGNQRATVEVPDTATAGELSVTTGGVTVGRLPFRRTTFAIGLQRFLPSYDQAGGARQPSMLSIARSGATSEVVKGYLYVLGGSANGAPLTSIERAVINADGSLGTFSAVPVALVAPRAGHESVVVGDYLYVLGGSGSGGALASVERARIAADGTLGAFETVSSTRLTAPRKLASIAMVGAWLYVIGGADTEMLNTVERASINVDGSLGPFAVVTEVSLTTAREGHTSHVIGEALYVIGGSGNTGQLNTIERATIRPDGSLESFASVVGVTLTSSRTEHSSVVLGGKLYVIGGSNSNGALASVERASINRDDTLDSFSPGLDLASARFGHTGAIVGNWYYIVGGAGAADLKTLERASINASDGLGSFAMDAGTSLVTGRHSYSSAIIGNYFYVIGGWGGSTTITVQNSVERAIIGPDGTAGPFATVAGVSLNTGRAGHTSVVLGNYIYVVGGINNSKLGSIERAAVNPDGSLGPFALVAGVQLVTPRTSHSSTVIGRYLYILGGLGDVGNGFLNSIERAVIFADGTLTDFESLPVTLTAPRYIHSNVMIGNSLYVIGGAGFGGGFASIERAAINGDGSLSAFQIGSNLTSPATMPVTQIIGKYLYVMGDYVGQGVFERAEIGAGTLGAFIAATGVLARHGSQSAVLGNSVYVFGGYISGTPLSNIEHAIIQ